MTSMAGSSRTLYQASLDGWLPKYLTQGEQERAPPRHADQSGFNLVCCLVQPVHIGAATWLTSFSISSI